jgi:hypothetical protein
LAVFELPAHIDHSKKNIHVKFKLDKCWMQYIHDTQVRRFV